MPQMTSPASPPQQAQPRSVRKVDLQELLGASRELVIVHNGREYRLRLTQYGKLILTA